jgi:hypothetical protein
MGKINDWERMGDDVFFIIGQAENGGFGKYLLNSTGNTAEKANEYFREICAFQTTEFLTKVASVFPDGIVPRDRAKWDSSRN